MQNGDKKKLNVGNGAQKGQIKNREIMAGSEMVIRANGQMRGGVKILCFRYLQTNYILFAFKLKTNYCCAVIIISLQYPKAYKMSITHLLINHNLSYEHIFCTSGNPTPRLYDSSSY